LTRSASFAAQLNKAARHGYYSIGKYYYVTDIKFSTNEKEPPPKPCILWIITYYCSFEEGCSITESRVDLGL